MALRKRKGAEIVVESTEPPRLLDLGALRVFLYENDLYRNGRYTSNKAFNDKLGAHGSEFDFVMRNTFQSFVRKHIHLGPKDIIEFMLDYLVSGNVINEAFGHVYLNVRWETKRVTVHCSYNLQTAISHYRNDFWRFLKSLVLRPCHLDTNLALSHYWGERTTEACPGFVYMFGKTSIYDEEFYAFPEDVDVQSVIVHNCNAVMGIPDFSDYDTEEECFSDQMTENIFELFLTLIDSIISYIEESVADFRDNLSDENPDDVPIDKLINVLDGKLASWKSNMYQLDLTVFTLVHEAMELCKIYHKHATTAIVDTSVDTSTPITPGDSTTPSVIKRIPDFEMCYLALKHHRILADSVVNLRSSHVWLFFAYGKSFDTHEWLLNPCGHWNRTHATLEDFIKSETAEYWMKRVNSTSMITYARLCWLILFNHAPEITLKSTMEKDAVYLDIVSYYNCFLITLKKFIVFFFVGAPTQKVTPHRSLCKRSR